MALALVVWIYMRLWVLPWGGPPALFESLTKRQVQTPYKQWVLKRT